MPASGRSFKLEVQERSLTLTIFDLCKLQGILNLNDGSGNGNGHDHDDGELTKDDVETTEQ